MPETVVDLTALAADQDAVADERAAPLDLGVGLRDDITCAAGGEWCGVPLGGPY